MAVEERARQDLFDRLEQVLGTPHALTLMAYLPQVEGPDVATSGDVAQVRSDLTDLDLNLGQRFEAIDQRFEAMDQRFEAIDRRFDAVDHRFELVDQRFAALERHIDTRRSTASWARSAARWPPWSPHRRGSSFSAWWEP
ncbi:MAG: hypothetical protein H0T98_01735 [Euzebyaceae bacterium]|nr:hypothetical protein [Euzebyaceae bacterium]